MTLTFHGAAREVTGSAHLLTLDDGYKILLDCGLYQGRNKEMEDFNEHFPFDPRRDRRTRTQPRPYRPQRTGT